MLFRSDWPHAQSRLAHAAGRLEAAASFGLPFLPRECAAPLPRAYQWVDGSAYLSHMERVRRARGAVLPPNLRADPVLYQGGSDTMLGPTDDIEAISEDHGIDFEAEVAVITDDVRMGVEANNASAHIKLVTLVNDVSLRNLIPGELAKGFGFLQGKPASSFAPVAATPDELGPAWDGRRLRLPIQAFINGQPFGSPDAGEGMTFDFAQLIAHAARTRRLSAGTIIGSGTVSNADLSRGYCCIAERRSVEAVEAGAPRTPFLKFGDRVRIEMTDAAGGSIFGAIDQRVVPYRRIA